MFHFFIVLAVVWTPPALNAQTFASRNTQITTFVYSCWKEGVLTRVESNSGDKDKVCDKPSFLNICDGAIEKIQKLLTAENYVEEEISQSRGRITIIAKSQPQLFPPAMANDPADYNGFFTRTYRLSISPDNCSFSGFEVTFTKSDRSGTLVFIPQDASSCDFSATLYERNQQLQSESPPGTPSHLSPMHEYFGRVCYQIKNQVLPTQVRKE